MTIEYIITCIRKNSQGIITHVGIEQQVIDIQTVAERIWAREANYYTIAMGIRVKVFAMRNSDTNDPYLTTAANDKLPNNLKFLPKCA